MVYPSLDEVASFPTHIVDRLLWTLCHFISCTPLLLGPTYAPPKCGPMPPSRELIALQNSTCLLPQGQDSSARPCSL